MFPRVELTDDEKKLLLATVIQLAPEAMFSHHFYVFGGDKFQQKEGGPIGLRGTCTISRLMMQIYDRRWVRRVMKSGLELKLYMRYMDDGRKFMHPVKKGWRWVGEKLQYSLGWESEDGRMDRSHVDMTISVLRESVKGIMGFLNFTFESREDYGDNWLPTLDTEIRINGSNLVEYRYFEKPTTTNTAIRMTSAMGENGKM